jgi:protein-S-isoprenylcysteine O-methyltransferase Ste14
MTGYILLAIPLEERDLERALGEGYRRWRESTPAFVPGASGPGAASGSEVAGSIRS